MAPYRPTSTPDRPWRLVAIGFAALAISFSLRAALSVAMPALETDFGRPRVYFSGVAALTLLLMAAAAPFAGAAVDRRPPRLLFAGGLGAIAVGGAIAAAAPSVLVFVIGFGAVAALGFTLVGTNVVAAAITKRFTAQAGLATGIATAGATAGQLAVVPFVAALIQVASWRLAFAALAIAALVLATVALWTLDSRDAPRGAPREAQASAMPIGSLLRIRAFHVLFWSFLACGFTTAGVIETHLLPYAAFCGFPPLPSASAYGLLCLVNMVGMIAAGALTDRVHRPTLLAVIYLARAATFLLLMQLAAASDIRLLYLFAIVFGVFDYASVPVTVGLAASHIGTERLGVAIGLISGGHALGAAAGAFIGGALFDGVGRYAELWAISLFLSAAGGLAVIVLLPDQPDGRDRKLKPGMA